MKHGGFTMRTLVILALPMMVACSSGSSDDGGTSAEEQRARCGNGRIDVGEQCDGSDVAGRTCESLSRELSGTVGCTDDCHFDLATCTSNQCGNGVRDEGLASIDLACEQCDGTDLGGATCAGYGGSGDLRCTDVCRTDRTTCDGICGNGRIEVGEACDFDPVTGASMLPTGTTCESLGLGTGNVRCFKRAGRPTPHGIAVSQECELETFGCEQQTHVCGNGVVEAGEECDGTELREHSCADVQLVGTLQCSSECTLDFGACAPAPLPAVCGNGVIESGEECDGNRFAPIIDDPTGAIFACAHRAAYDNGPNPCIDCRIDRSRCAATEPAFACGDGVASLHEDCDGEDLRGVTCADLGGDGALGCSSSCRFDRTGCNGVAGNARREEGEPCDVDPESLSPDVGDRTCASLGYGVGELGCGLSARSYPFLFPWSGSDPVVLPSILTFGCSRPATCGDGQATNYEQCDGDDLAGATCATFDAEGELGCNQQCQFDLSGCTSTARCGNGLIEFGEACEPDMMRSTCSADGGDGDYACDPATCTFVLAGCSFQCGF